MTHLHDEIARCTRAQRDWAQRPVATRLQAVREFRSLLVEWTCDLTAAIESDLGRPPAEVIATDFLPTASAAKFLLDYARRLLRPRRIAWRPLWLIGCRDTVHRRPRGLVGLIGTWNYPLFLNAVPSLQALAAGNGVLWKPSEQTPSFAEVFTRLMHEAGFPSDLFVTLPATRETGPLLADADIHFLHFTGSEPVGRRLAARLGERLIPSTLELSGCDACFVLDGADIRQAARAAWCGMIMNSGQTCMAVRRIFVQRSIVEAFTNEIRALLEKTPRLQVQLASQADAMRERIGEAAVRGAELFGDPPPPDGCREVWPVMVLSEDTRLGICQEALFCPLSQIIPFDDLDEAVARQADCRFGLAASIFSGDRRQAEALAARLKAGSVVINDAIAPAAHPATPFGGRDASGWGVSQGEEGLLEMTVPQVVTYRRGKFRPHVDTVLTRDPATGDVMHGLLRFTHARKLSERWRGLKQMILGMRRFGKVPT